MKKVHYWNQFIMKHFISPIFLFSFFKILITFIENIYNQHHRLNYNLRQRFLVFFVSISIADEINSYEID